MNHKQNKRNHSKSCHSLLKSNVNKQLPAMLRIVESHIPWNHECFVRLGAKVSGHKGANKREEKKRLISWASLLMTGCHTRTSSSKCNDLRKEITVILCWIWLPPLFRTKSVEVIVPIPSRLPSAAEKNNWYLWHWTKLHVLFSILLCFLYREKKIQGHRLMWWWCLLQTMWHFVWPRCDWLQPVFWTWKIFQLIYLHWA